MKKFKIGFLAIVAMSFAVASNIEIKVETKRFALGPEDCFLPSVSSDGKYVCSDNLIDVVASDCTIAQAKFDDDTSTPFHLYGLNTSGFIESGNIQTTCNGDDKFCCFTVKEDTNPLAKFCTPFEPKQPTIAIGVTTKYWIIDEVYCKP